MYLHLYRHAVSILTYQVWSGDKESERNSEECELKEVVPCTEKPQEQKGKSTQKPVKWFQTKHEFLIRLSELKLKY